MLLAFRFSEQFLRGRKIAVVIYSQLLAAYELLLTQSPSSIFVSFMLEVNLFVQNFSPCFKLGKLAQGIF